MNGTGTTISPMPAYGELSIAMKWFTLFFIPLIPLGWQLVQAGAKEGDIVNWSSTQYIIKKRLTYSEVKEKLGLKGMLLTLAYSYCTGIGALGLFIGLCLLLLPLKYLLLLIFRSF
jgi:hypothetical protein